MQIKNTLMALDFMRQAIALALENVRNGGGPFAADGSLRVIRIPIRVH